jgi:preprotein translocase subunit YajC
MHPLAETFLFFAQQTAAPAAAPAGAPGLFSNPIIFFALFLGAMYFLLIAPQRKKQKEQAKMLAALQTGDEVLTNGGIFGVIANIKEDRFVVRVGDDTKIEIAKGFVQSLVKKSGS